MTIIIDGNKVSEGIREHIKKDIEKHKLKPVLAVVLVGENPASKVYVKLKEKRCAEVGIESRKIHLNEGTSQQELHKEIDRLNADDVVNGILMQLPLPPQLDENLAVARIDPAKDVDGITPVSMGKLLRGEDGFVSCTPQGVMLLLDESGVDLPGKHAVVIGRSNIVGKPQALLLLQQHATVTICHSRTQNLKEITKQADVLIAAVGQPGFVKADMVKDGVVVIDVGINRVGDKLVGDVDFEAVKDKASAITPVPGGVGPLTIACLLKNAIKAYRSQNP
ncbi:MAG: bifunctional methylenetetrahydrofolate dehydrogenase/methenyltetrahydrofolate cyclohydrolase FolD [archaeon]